MAVSLGVFFVNDFHLFRESGHAHVLVVPTSALFRVDDAGERLLAALSDQRGGPFDPEALAAHPIHGSRLDPETLATWIDELSGLDLLVPEERAGTDPGIVRDTLLPYTEPPVGTVTALVSKECNLTCAYCYADQGRFGSGTGATWPSTRAGSSWIRCSTMQGPCRRSPTSSSAASRSFPPRSCAASSPTARRKRRSGASASSSVSRRTGPS